MITGKTELTDAERQLWKQTYLSLLYGGGVTAVQRYQAGMTREQAKGLIKTFHNNFPAVHALQDRVLAQHKRRGYIIGLDGRHLHMEEFGEHKLLNKLIQGSAAGLIKQAIRNVHRYLRSDPDLQSRMVSVVHDDLMFDGPTHELEELHVEIPPLMVVYDHVNEIVPILVDHEVSTATWADKLGYDEWLAATREEVAV